MSKFYAGIGSRKTPSNIIKIMERVGEFLATKGYTLRSGAAKGADAAFERGCDRVEGDKEIYLPWERFENHSSKLYFKKSPIKEMKEKAFKLSEKYHPSWDNCSYGAKCLLARDAFQVLGSDLKSPVRFVVCWTPSVWKPGTKAGGTSQALRIAYDKDIRIFNLCDENELSNVVDHIALNIDLTESTSYNLFDGKTHE